MKRKLLLAAIVAVASAIGGGSSAMAQENIIKDWDGSNLSTDELQTKKPTDFGWSSSRTGRNWGVENGVDARFTTNYPSKDDTKYYLAEGGSEYTYSANSELSTKILWIRYDNNEVYTYTFSGLEPDHSYKFSGLVGWHNNSSNPTFTIGVDGDSKKYGSATQAISGNENKRKLYAISFDFVVPAEDKLDNYYLRFSCNTGSDCMEALSALSIVEDLDAYKTRLEEKIAEAKLVPGENEGLAQAISVAETAVKSDVTYDIYATNVESLEKSIADARESNKKNAIAKEGTKDVPAEWTGAIVNPSFEEGESLWTMTANSNRQMVPAGWTPIQTWKWNDNFWANKSTENATEGDNSYLVRFNWAATTYSISQKITSLPRGTYKLTADVTNKNTSGSKFNARVTINEEFKGEVLDMSGSDDQTSETIEVDFFLSEDGDIDIKLTSVYMLGTNSCEGILYWDNVRLYNYGTEAIEAAELEAAQKALTEEINATKTKVPTANVGNEAFQIPTEAVDALNEAIKEAEDKLESANKAEVEKATESLKEAVAEYEETEINEPTAERYTLQNVSTNWKDYVRTTDSKDGWYGVDFSDFEGAYLTFVKDGRPDQGNYAVNIGLSYGANKPVKGYKQNDAYAQAFKFEKAEGLNKYYISQTDDDGTPRYLTTAKTAYTNNNPSYNQIRTVVIENPEEDKTGAYAFTIVPTAEEGVYNIYVEDAKQNIDFQDQGAYAANYGHASFAIAEAKKASVSINIAAGKYGTVIYPFAPEELPAGVKAYSVKEVSDNVLNLVDETELKANVPYILENTNTKAITNTQTGFGTAKEDSYNAGLLTGVYTTDPVKEGNYVLQTQEGVQAFYQIADESSLTAVPYRAYLTYEAPGDGEEAGIKALYFDFAGDATAIEAVPEVAEGAKVFYNLAGQRVANPTKGIYIVNGQKVLVK